MEFSRRVETERDPHRGVSLRARGRRRATPRRAAVVLALAVATALVWVAVLAGAGFALGYPFRVSTLIAAGLLIGLFVGAILAMLPRNDDALSD